MKQYLNLRNVATIVACLAVMTTIFTGCGKDEPAGNQKPTCSITSPTNNAQFFTDENIVIAVAADDKDGTIAEVQLYVDNIGNSFKTVFPYNFTINAGALAVGAHTIKAVAKDNDGASAEASVSISITIKQPAFVAVTNITNVPTLNRVGTSFLLTGAVIPSNATNQTIVWSIVSAGGTGATLSGNMLNTTAEGKATVRATIINGASTSTNYIQEFTIEFVAVQQEAVTAIDGAGIQQFSVVAGSFLNKTNATALKDRMANAGYQSFLAQNDRGMYRVIVATFSDLASAFAEREMFRSKFYPDFQDAWILEKQ